MTRHPLDGPTALKRLIGAFATLYPEEMGNALYRVGQGTLNKSARLVPVDTGVLRGSRYIDDPDVRPGRIAVSMGYSTDYAAEVHERLDVPHNPPTQAKYLEDPLLEDLPIYPQAILEAVEGLIEREASHV